MKCQSTSYVCDTQLKTPCYVSKAQAMILFLENTVFQTN